MTEEDCKCIKLSGHLEAVKWMLWPREYRASPGVLALGDWTKDPFVWLHYVESSDGLLADDDVLRSTDTKYWSIHDVQRYFVGELHCERVLFPHQYPNLKMPTPLGNHLWNTNAALKLPPSLYLKELQMSLETTLKKMEARGSQMNRLIVSDQLVKLDRLDFFKRKTFFRIMHNILSVQDDLQLVSLENLCCRRLEGVRVLQQLACFNAHSLKYLFLWRFVLPGENPLLVNYSYITGSGRHVPRPGSRQCFLRCLAELRNLRVLALEYAHLADGSGGALLALLPLLRRPHFRLQLICREDQVPGRADPSLGVGGHDIPDTAWRRVAVVCPDLYLFMAFFRVREYESARRFLSPSMPLREAHLQLGIELRARARQPSDVCCFLRLLAYRHADTLVTLSIHQWRFVELPVGDVLRLLPRLVRLRCAGLVAEPQLRAALRLVACGVCDRLKQLSIQIQDEESKREHWRRAVDDLTEEFGDIMQLFDVKFCLDIYKN